MNVTIVLRHYNPQNKELRGAAIWLVPTVTASTMVARVMGCGQGQMSQWTCGNSWDSVVPRPQRDVAIRHFGFRNKSGFYCSVHTQLLTIHRSVAPGVCIIPEGADV